MLTCLWRFTVIQIIKKASGHSFENECYQYSSELHFIHQLTLSSWSERAVCSMKDEMSFLFFNCNLLLYKILNTIYQNTKQMSILIKEWKWEIFPSNVKYCLFRCSICLPFLPEPIHLTLSLFTTLDIPELYGDSVKVKIPFGDSYHPSSIWTHTSTPPLLSFSIIPQSTAPSITPLPSTGPRTPL